MRPPPPRKTPLRHGKARRRRLDHRMLWLGTLELLRLEGLGVVTEFWFDPDRRWRLDLAVPSVRVGVEIHGGAWLRGPDGLRGGAHHRPAGRRRDMAKMRRAQELGWIVGEFEPQDMPGEVVRWIVAACERRAESGSGS